MAHFKTFLITALCLIHEQVLVHAQTVPPGTPTFACPKPDGFFAIPNSCTGDYYVCVNNSPYVDTCPAGAIFDPTYLTCLSPDQATCTVFYCPTSNGFYPIPGVLYCSNSYYICIDFITHVQTCPGNSIFDPLAPSGSACVPLGTQRCVQTTLAPTPSITPSTTTTSTTPSTTTTSTTPSTTTTESTTTPSTTTTSTTPSTTTTTATTTTTSTTPTTTTTTPPPFKCPGTGNYPTGTCSSTYYLCSGTTLLGTATCPIGQYFNPSTQYCGTPAEVGCPAAFDFIQYYRGFWKVGMV